MPEKALSEEIKEINAALRQEVADLADRIEDLTASNDALVESNEKLSNSDTNQRRGIIALTIGGLVLAGILSGVLYAMVQIDKTNDRLDKQGEYDRASCERANEQRAAHRQQWIDTRALLTALGAGAETRKLANGLVAKAEKNYPPLNCKAVVNGDQPQSILPLPVPGVKQ